MLRTTLVHLDILSILYIKRMEAQSNNLFWFSQTKQENFQLLYISSKEENLPNQNKAHSSSYLSSICIKGKVSINNASDQQCGLGTYQFHIQTLKWLTL